MEERLVYLVMGHKPSEGERCLAVFETAEEAFNFDPPAHFGALVVWQWPIGASREAAQTVRR